MVHLPHLLHRPSRHNTRTLQNEDQRTLCQQPSYSARPRLRDRCIAQPSPGLHHHQRATFPQQRRFRKADTLKRAETAGPITATGFGGGYERLGLWGLSGDGEWWNVIKWNTGDDGDLGREIGAAGEKVIGVGRWDLGEHLDF